MLVLLRVKTKKLWSYLWILVICRYFPDIFNMSGVPEMVAKYGDFFSYDQSPRAQIFRRDQSEVVDIESMIKIMRQDFFVG